MPCNCLLGLDFISCNKFRLYFDDVLRIEAKPISDFLTNDVLMINDVVFQPEIPLDIDDTLPKSDSFKITQLFNDVYVHKNTNKTVPVDFEMNIVVNKEHVPFYIKPKRMSFFEKTELDNTIKDLLSKGL